MSKAYYKIENQWAVVYHEGKKVAAFSLLAEDFAVTMARDYVYNLQNPTGDNVIKKEK